MAEWKITVVNQTGDDGSSPEEVNVMLFQVPQQLEVDSWTNAWNVAEVGYPATVGPIVLPAKVEFYVIDESYKTPRKTGPFPVQFGQTYTVVQKKPNEAPTIERSSEVAPEGQIKVINASGNAKPLQMALYKNGSSLLSFRAVRPADAVYLSVEPAIYIADVDGSVVEGDNFKAVDQAVEATKFQLFPAKTDFTILIKKLPSGQINFVKSSE